MQSTKAQARKKKSSPLMKRRANGGGIDGRSNKSNKVERLVIEISNHNYSFNAGEEALVFCIY